MSKLKMPQLTQQPYYILHSQMNSNYFCEFNDM